MPTFVSDDEMNFGDVVLNYGDPVYSNSRGLTAQDNALRLFA